jgi:hypothetical protein
MKKWLIGLLCGVVLGSTGTAGAVVVQKAYWAESGADYSCAGTGSGMLCKSSGFRYGVTKDFIFISKGYKTAKGPVFACPKWERWQDCFKG